MSGTRRITVKIAGKEFAMTVPQADEEKYRRAAKDINSLISEYRRTFAAEPEDYLAMAAMQMSVNKVGMEMDRSNTDQLKALDEIGLEIEHYFSEVNPGE